MRETASEAATIVADLDWQEVIVRIRLAQASIDQELGARVEHVEDFFTRRRTRALEVCDRAVLEVTHEAVRRELERAVEELDLLCAQVASALQEVCTYDLFDPLRVLVADVRQEQQLPSPIQRG